MRKAWKAGLLVLGAAALAGCAAMNQHECQLGDWHTVGFDDGAKGVPVTRLADYAKACSKYGISPDLTAYRSGYDLGLESYCRDTNGFIVGSRGALYDGVCPATLEPQFLQGYRVGRQLFELQSAVNGLEGQIAESDRELHETAERLAAVQAAIIGDATTADQRASLLAEVSELSQRQGSLQIQLVELQRTLALRQSDLGRFRESIAYNP